MATATPTLTETTSVLLEIARKFHDDTVYTNALSTAEVGEPELTALYCLETAATRPGTLTPSDLAILRAELDPAADLAGYTEPGQIDTLIRQAAAA